MVNKKMIAGTLVCALALVQAQMVFGADPDDFTSALGDGNFSKAERVLKSSARKWSAKQQENVWFYTLIDKNISNNAAMRGAQLLRQYDVSFRDNDLLFPMSAKRSEELVRYLVDAGMPLKSAVYACIEYGYSDNLMQLLLDKNAEISNEAFQKAAEKQRWKFVPQLIAKLSADDMSYRTTREEHQAKDWVKVTNTAFDPAQSKTPLMWAAQYGQLNIVKLLVEKGAKVNLRADDGATAASLAYDNGEIEIYNYLKANGAVDYDPKAVAASSVVNANTAPVPQQSYSPPPSSSTSSAANSSSGTSAGVQVLNSIQQALKSPLQTGVYVMSGRTETITFSAIGSSGIMTYKDAAGKSSQGSYSISNNRITMSILGKTFIYTMTDDTSFSGNGEAWYRRGAF